MNRESKKGSTSPLYIRETEASDRTQIARLLAGSTERHLHLDWFTTYELLDQRPSLVVIEENSIVAMLACPPDPKTIGWIRQFAVLDGKSTKKMWGLLWDKILDLAPGQGIITVAVLVTQPWFSPILSGSGFSQTNEVIFMEHNGESPMVELPPQATLRTMLVDDLETVATVDQHSFNPLWQHSLRALTAAYHLSSLATVIEVDNNVVAYQISTSSALGAHLARLAVEPQAQGQGLAKTLVAHAIRYFERRGITRMSVNTQSDNTRSQVLYEKLGFKPTGQRFPVLTYKL